MNETGPIIKDAAYFGFWTKAALLYLAVSVVQIGLLVATCLLLVRLCRLVERLPR